MSLAHAPLFDDEEVQLQILSPAPALGTRIDPGDEDSDAVGVCVDDLGSKLVWKLVVLVVGELVLSGVNQDHEGRC